MGRKEERLRKKLKKESFKKAKTPERTARPFVMDDTRYIPVKIDDAMIPMASDKVPDVMTPQEFERMTHNLSDTELNRIIYQNALDAVENGLMPEWPEDDFGLVSWFAWSFITDEMRTAFPAIASEYLTHYRDEGNGPASGSFHDVPYPRMQEKTWDDAYYYRVILMMLFSTRKGDVYSRNALLSLYKVYYKPEYKKLKRIENLTFLDVLELHDEDCLRKGLPSGHAVDAGRTFRQIEIERRMHEPGWMNAYGDRALSHVPGKRADKTHEGDMLDKALKEIKDISDAPDEPPLQPTASRLFVMCELLGISIDVTCNEQAVIMNSVVDSMMKLQFTNSPQYRKLRNELVERTIGMLRAEYPEMFDPYEYQTDPKYLSLQIAEAVMTDVFNKYDTYVRMPYNSSPFILPQLAADLTITLEMYFPDLEISFNEMLMLSMVQYLSECLCQVMEARDTELEDILHFSRRREKGEWKREEGGSPEGSVLTEKAIRSMGILRDHIDEPVREEPAAEELGEEGLRAEIERLRAELNDREAALAEAEQKVIRQRVLYENAREQEELLRRKADEAVIEHQELIALREYVYGLKTGEPEEQIDKETREQIIGMIRDKKVTVLGGTERWIKRMKKLLPSWSFIGVDDNSIGAYHAMERADYIYIYTSALKHAQYYRAMSLIKSTGKVLFYLGSTNVDENLTRFKNDLCR